MRMREWLERAKQGPDLPAAPEPYEGNLAPIFTCAAAARQDAVELLAAGWNPQRLDQDRRTPIDASIKAGCPKLTRTFREFSARPHSLLKK